MTNLRNNCELPPQFLGVEAVCFDAFGTLIEITERRSAFRPLLQALPTKKKIEFKYRLMREDRALGDWPDALGVHVGREVVLEVQARVAVEVASVRLRAGVEHLLDNTCRSGLPIAICSNLASPYASCLRTCLGGRSSLHILSCEVGAIKPEQIIYEHVEAMLGLERRQVLFVGDSLQADIEGPRAFGFRAEHIGKLIS